MYSFFKKKTCTILSLSSISTILSDVYVNIMAILPQKSESTTPPPRTTPFKDILERG